MDRARDARGRFVSGEKKAKAPKPRPKRKRLVAAKQGGGRRKWSQALKQWNRNRDVWTIPKKRTPEYRQVKEIENRL